MKSNVSFSEDWVGGDKGKFERGFWNVRDKAWSEGLADCKPLDKPGREPAVSPDNTERLLRITAISSHSSTLGSSGEHLPSAAYSTTTSKHHG